MMEESRQEESRQEKSRQEENRQEKSRKEERRKEENRREEKKPRFRPTHSGPAKAAALLLMLVSMVVCLAAATVCFIAAEADMYTTSYPAALRNALSGMAYQTAERVKEYFDSGYEESARLYLQEINAEAAILKTEDRLAPDSSVFLWQSYEKSAAKEQNGFYSDIYEDVWSWHYLDYDERLTGGEFIVRVFFDPALVLNDDIRTIARLAEVFYSLRYAAIGFCVGSFVLIIICGVFLLCGAGHREGKEEIVPGILTGIPFDVLTVGIIIVAGCLFGISMELFNGDLAWLIILATCPILSFLYLWDFAIRVKLGKFWRNTIIYRFLRLLWRMLRCVFSLIARIPLVWSTVVVYLGICFLEFFGMALFTRVYAGALFLWVVEKLLLFAVVLYIALTIRKLQEAGGKLAQGQADYRVDTRYMYGAFKKQGENLNSLGQGVSKAVAERMKSERMKTELITNVSHDLKTPLTSIINYAELISREAEAAEGNAALREYAEVLLRQSGRLKRLLENLVEASKAVTGNLEVHLEPCEADVLLSQAVGEYQQRLEEKSLDLRVSRPEEPVKILADGRYLWRVFDNLLNNICKYAQEGSRVYLTLDRQRDRALIVFRNMSKYALDISPSELEERFVRGDRSRHLEGNGLGLSIAKSLTELQGGRMDIVIDGDLFKVTLTFEVLKEAVEL